MENIVKSLVNVEKSISKEKGGFVLFGIFLPENTHNKYDLLISANWIGPIKRDHFLYFAKEIKKELSSDELLNISRIVILDPARPFVSNVNSAISTEHNSILMENNYFNNVLIKRAYLITSKRRRNNIK